MKKLLKDPARIFRVWPGISNNLYFSRDGLGDFDRSDLVGK